LVPHRLSPDASCGSLWWSWCGCAAVIRLVAEQARVEAAQVGLLLVPPLPLR
jgi:prolipoprotein diacylglyceryltransferase